MNRAEAGSNVFLLVLMAVEKTTREPPRMSCTGAVKRDSAVAAMNPLGARGPLASEGSLAKGLAAPGEPVEGALVE